ncbi:MAG: hypothetical protein WC875_03200 [Candidatus Absconditabacterales bacterium]|jgi:hypothetical protein
MKTLIIILGLFFQKKRKNADKGKIKILRTPSLIQRCEIDDGKLTYDYMGNTEFEVDDLQPKSLKRIFSAGICIKSVNINVLDGKEIIVYMIAGEGFPFVDYQPYLQQLVDDKHGLSLQEWTNFDDAVKAQLEVKTPFMEAFGHAPHTNAWFDLRNDVLWTLTEENHKALVSILETIKQKWSAKKVVSR